MKKFFLLLCLSSILVPMVTNASVVGFNCYHKEKGISTEGSLLDFDQLRISDLRGSEYKVQAYTYRRNQLGFGSVKLRPVDGYLHGEFQDIGPLRLYKFWGPAAGLGNRLQIVIDRDTNLVVSVESSTYRKDYENLCFAIDELGNL